MGQFLLGHLQAGVQDGEGQAGAHVVGDAQAQERLAATRPRPYHDQLAGPQPADRVVQVRVAGGQARVDAVLDRLEDFQHYLGLRTEGGAPGERGGVLD